MKYILLSLLFVGCNPVTYVDPYAPMHYERLCDYPVPALYHVAQRVSGKWVVYQTVPYGTYYMRDYGQGEIFSICAAADDATETVDSCTALGMCKAAFEYWRGVNEKTKLK
jgi:hypothetical protein